MFSRKNLAKLACGAQAFHALWHTHAYFAGAFAIPGSPSWEVAGALLNGSAALWLGLYGWSPDPESPSSC